MLGGRVVGLVVHTHDDGVVDLLAGGGDDDLLGAVVQVGLAGLAGLELASGLEDDVCAHACPVEVLGVAVLEGLDAVAVEDEVAVLGAGLVKGNALAGVVLGQVGSALQVGGVVDGHHLDFRIGLRDAEDQAADAAKTVDANLDGHVKGSFSA